MAEHGPVPDFFACGGPCAESYWQRFEPAAMMRRAEAGRELARVVRAALDMVGVNATVMDRIVGPSLLGTLEPIARAFAATWEKHPDYEEGWKP